MARYSDGLLRPSLWRRMKSLLAKTPRLDGRPFTLLPLDRCIVALIALRRRHGITSSASVRPLKTHGRSATWPLCGPVWSGLHSRHVLHGLLKLHLKHLHRVLWCLALLLLMHLVAQDCMSRSLPARWLPSLCGCAGGDSGGQEAVVCGPH